MKYSKFKFEVVDAEAIKIHVPAQPPFSLSNNMIYQVSTTNLNDNSHYEIPVALPIKNGNFQIVAGWRMLQQQFHPTPAKIPILLVERCLKPSIIEVLALDCGSSVQTNAVK
jgi:hypothetical protein